MSNEQSLAIRNVGIDIVEQREIPMDAIPEAAMIEIAAKIDDSYYSNNWIIYQKIEIVTHSSLKQGYLITFALQSPHSLKEQHESPTHAIWYYVFDCIQYQSTRYTCIDAYM